MYSSHKVRGEPPSLHLARCNCQHVCKHTIWSYLKLMVVNACVITKAFKGFWRFGVR